VSTRQRYLDNLKVLLIALIIVGHAVVSYAGLDWWSYGEVREVTLRPVTEVVLLVVGGPFAVVMIPVLFLIAGLLTEPSLQRKAPARTRETVCYGLACRLRSSSWCSNRRRCT
jgi:hypothetical protein